MRGRQKSCLNPLSLQYLLLVSLPYLIRQSFILYDSTMILQVKNLFAEYENCPILNDISFELLQGEFVCFCGTNGCGKSTLLNVLANVQNDSLKITNANSKKLPL